MNGGPNSTVIIDAKDFSPGSKAVKEIEIELPNAKAAMEYQQKLIDSWDLGKYDVYENSCLTHVTDVMEAGGNPAVAKTKRGKNDFVKKEKLHKREEVISFSSRKGRAPHTDQTYIGVTSGIYYKDLNSLDKKIVQDFLNSYPVISGSIGHYKKEESGYLSIPIKDSSQIEYVSNEIIENIEKRSFQFIFKISDLRKLD